MTLIGAYHQRKTSPSCPGEVILKPSTRRVATFLTEQCPALPCPRPSASDLSSLWVTDRCSGQLMPEWQNIYITTIDFSYRIFAAFMLLLCEVERRSLSGSSSHYDLPSVARSAPSNALPARSSPERHAGIYRTNNPVRSRHRLSNTSRACNARRSRNAPRAFPWSNRPETS